MTGFLLRVYLRPTALVALDYSITAPLEPKALSWRYARAATEAAGEPSKFVIDSTPPSSKRLAELLQSCGLSLGEHHTLGKVAKGERAWGRFATADVR